MVLFAVVCCNQSVDDIVPVIMFVGYATSLCLITVLSFKIVSIVSALTQLTLIERLELKCEALRVHKEKEKKMLDELNEIKTRVFFALRGEEEQ
jgi:hypothetical protein